MPEDLARQAVTHASWVERRAESYERLAFLGDSVLALAITTHLFPLLEGEAEAGSSAVRDGAGGAGRMTKVRAQAVSRRSNRAVARTSVRSRVRMSSPRRKKWFVARFVPRFRIA